MKDFLKTFMGLGITLGLSDREKFVKSVSGILQEYQDDPEKAEKWSKALADYLQGVKDNYNLQNAIKNAVTDMQTTDKKSVSELTGAIQELTKQLEMLNSKK